jgi:hypothetical protein
MFFVVSSISELSAHPAVIRAGPYNSRTTGKRENIMGEPIRIGAVNYLNTKPLIENLESIAPNISL